jgi:hypothetical protein
MERPGLREVSLVRCEGTTVAFEDALFTITSHAGEVRISSDPTSYAVVTATAESVPYESTVEAGVAVNEERVGAIDYGPYFVVQWEDDVGLPSLLFRRPPRAVQRSYTAGQAIEFGIEEAGHYHIRYRDGVEADFMRTSPDRIEFSFSTGFYGSCRKEADGSCLLRFRGDRLKPTEEAHQSQSKFIVSRSKYTGNLLLILQDAATVTVS